MKKSIKLERKPQTIATNSPLRRPIRSDKLPKPIAPANSPAMKIEVEIEFAENIFGSH